VNLLVKRGESRRVTEIFNPGNSDSTGLELALIRPDPGVPVETVAEGRESLLVILGGRCAIAVDGAGSWEGLGERADVFGGAPTSVYVPAGVPHRITADGPAEVAVWRAPAAAGGEAYVIRPSEVPAVVRGDGAWRRRVYTILDASRPAQRLVAGETINEPGAWSSYPPHKHDRHDPPHEVCFQEIYHFRLNPRQGFGFQRVYAPERNVDITYVVEDGDTVLVPFGYHPVVAAPGYELYYLWALVGEGRTLMAREDPAHSWVTRAR